MPSVEDYFETERGQQTVPLHVALQQGVEVIDEGLATHLVIRSPETGKTIRCRDIRTFTASKPNQPVQFTYVILNRCYRCGGAGGWKGWPGFTCYRCRGSGHEPLKVVTPLSVERKRKKAAKAHAA